MRPPKRAAPPKTVRHGLCKLCLTDGELRQSHFMPAALYPKNRKNKFATPNGTYDIDRSNEVKDYVLCNRCEGRFDKNGESYVLGLLAAKARGRMPLLDKFRAATPLRVLPDLTLVYSTSSVGIDSTQIAYFALSLVWRSGVHDWGLPDGTTLSPINLGRYRESIRRYLLGVAEFPSETAVVAAVCTDALTREHWLLPTMGEESGYSFLHFQTLGLNFTVWLGPNIPTEARGLCCYSSPEKPVLSADCEYVTRAALNTLPPL